MVFRGSSDRERAPAVRSGSLAIPWGPTPGHRSRSLRTPANTSKTANYWARRIHVMGSAARAPRQWREHGDLLSELPEISGRSDGGQTRRPFIAKRPGILTPCSGKVLALEK